LGGFFLWRNQAKVTAWEAFNVILPIAFVSTIYLWAYDQLPYIIPVVWIMGTLVKRKSNYLHAFIFLIALVSISFFALVQQAGTSKDLWSLGTTILVLGMVLWLRFRPVSTAPVPA
jgi:membrane-associated HD superfamily phosphohydrolase